MDAAIWGFIGALSGTIVGASASIFTTIFNVRNTNRLQNDAHNLERIERSREFQRNNLLELQDTLQNAARLTGRLHHENLLAAKESGIWGKSLINEQLDQTVLSNNQKLTILIERIASDELRSNIKALRKTMTEIMFSKSELESENALRQVTDEFLATMEKLGTVLRQNF